MALRLDQLSAPATAGASAERERAALSALLDTASFEVSVAAARRIADFRSLFAPKTRIFVPFTPRTRLEGWLGLIARLGAEDMRPVPHLCARRLESRAALEDLLDELRARKVREILLIAGDAPQPEGPFASSLEVLESGLIERFAPERLYVAAHPEGHPHAAAAVLDRALAAKTAWSRACGIPLELVTQFGFDPEAPIRFEQGLTARGLALPLRVGLAGPASLTTLVRYAMSCGVRASASFLRSRGEKVLGLLAARAPDAEIAALADHLARHPGCLIRAIHLFPFGGIEASLAWLRGVRERMAAG